MRRTVLTVWLASLAPGFGLSAQSPWPVDAGHRVRVTTDSGTRIGTLVGQDSGAMLLRWADAPDSLVMAVPQHRIVRLDVSDGRQSNAGKGAAIGMGVGAVLGLALGIGCASSDSFFQCTTPEVAQITGITAFVGAGLGTLIGLTSTSEHWEPVRAGGEVRVSLAPRGVGVAVSIVL